MSRERLAYFLAGGRTKATIEMFHTQNRAHRDAMFEISRSLGLGDKLWFEGHRVVGFVAVRGQPIPDGLKKDAKTGMLVPEKKTDVGKAILARMRATPMAMAQDSVARACGMHEIMQVNGDKLVSTSVGWERIGVDLVVFTQADARGVSLSGEPYDSPPILTSRYWQMREAADAGEGAP